MTFDDDPMLDGTDGAHPAWWRGCDMGVEKACEAVELALAETPSGMFGSAKLQRVVDDVVALRSDAAKWQALAPAIEAFARAISAREQASRAAYEAGYSAPAVAECNAVMIAFAQAVKALHRTALEVAGHVEVTP